MNLYFRFFWCWLSTFFKPWVSIYQPVISRYRVLPNDIDLFGHMNNGRYFSIADLARMEVLMRNHLWKELKREGCLPVVVKASAQYKRALKLGQSYQIVTRMLGWDRRFFYVQQDFIVGKKLHTQLDITIRVLNPKGDSPTPKQVLEWVELFCVPEIRG